jgi:membrane protease YdiL (CAAX protease family)
MLSFSGVTDGWISEVVYYLAFILPLSIGLIYARSRGYTQGGELTLFHIRAGDVSHFLILTVPTLVLVMLTSQLTAWLLTSLTGATNQVVLTGGIWLSILEHALLPALLEELLFRYLPMRVIPRHEARLLVVLSSIFFAFAHTSLFSIPYALVAGVVYITVDLMTDSVIPSFFMHFVNNLASVLLICYNDDFNAKTAVFVTFGLLFAASLLCLAVYGKTIFVRVREKIFDSEPTALTPHVLLFIIPALLVAVLGLF